MQSCSYEITNSSAVTIDGIAYGVWYSGGGGTLLVENSRKAVLEAALKIPYFMSHLYLFLPSYHTTLL